MSERVSAEQTLTGIRADLAREDRRALLHARIGVGLRALVVLLVIGYMSWLSAAIGHLDAPTLTRFAATHIEERLPELRAELRDYAIAQAPDVIGRARDLLLQFPAHVRDSVERPLLARTDELIARAETDIDAAITDVLDRQMELLRAEMSDASPEEQLDAFILGVSDLFRDTMISALDELYVGYADEIRRLNAHLDHLLRDDHLTEDERIDKQLIQVWMVLVHQHEITNPMQVAATFQATFSD